MTTMKTENIACRLDLEGRHAIVDHKLTIVTSVRGGEIFTLLDSERGYDAESVVCLPVAGEEVELPDVIPEAVSGRWLGPAEMSPHFGEHFTALVLTSSGITELVMPIAQADARRIVRDGPVGDRDAMEALLMEARAHRCTRRDHTAWVDRLVADAHEEADNRRWCDVLCSSQAGVRPQIYRSTLGDGSRRSGLD